MSAEVSAPATTRAVPGRRGSVLAGLFVVAAIVSLPVQLAVPARLILLAPVALALLALAYARPVWAAYLLFVATPLTAGIARGAALPLLRPHEALGFLLGAGVAARAVAERRAGHRVRIRFTRLDVVILLMAVTSSVLPLLWMVARGLSPTADDLLYASTIWKFYGLFALIRACVRTEREVARCLYLSLAAYALVAVVTILQALQVADVPHLVNLIYATDDPRGAGAGRGSATLGSSIAIGDVMAFSLVTCLAFLRRRAGNRRLLGGLAVLFALGGLSSGQFSGVIAVVVSVFALAVLARRVRTLLAIGVPALLLGVAALWPVAQARLNDFDLSTGLPQSWTVRLDNLRLFVWPQVFTGENWLFGVRPSAQIAVDTVWGPYIYIESGHTWLLWTGGVPFAIAFLVFIWVATGSARRTARTRTDAVGVAGDVAFAGLCAVFVLMTFDPHITMRGTADLLFSLLALTGAAATRRPSEVEHVEKNRVIARATVPPPSTFPARTERRLAQAAPGTRTSRSSGPIRDPDAGPAPAARPGPVPSP